MTLQELQFRLELGCVMDRDINSIVEYCKTNGIDAQKVDAMLEDLGYEKIFDNDFEYDDFDDEYDDEYEYIEKFPNKHRFYDE